jgi:hypothetical protein
MGRDLKVEWRGADVLTVIVDDADSRVLTP